MEVFIVQFCNENIEAVFATPEEAQAYIEQAGFDDGEDYGHDGYDYEIWQVGEKN